MRALFAALLLSLSTITQGQTLGVNTQSSFGAEASPEFLPVEEAYQLEVVFEDEQNIRLYWQIADAYYLYQHAFKFKLEVDGKPMDMAVDYPQALDRTDEYFGDVSVYYNNADLQLRAASPLTAGGRLAVTFQGCADAGLCYPPKTQHFELSPGGGVTEIAAPPPQERGASYI